MSAELVISFAFALLQPHDLVLVEPMDVMRRQLYKFRDLAEAEEIGPRHAAQLAQRRIAVAELRP